MNENKAMPTDRGLQQFSSGINKKYETSLFETASYVPDSETGEPIPDMATSQVKNWVDEGSKL
ncbi:MAG: hypothetical protein LBI27_10370 [Clostridiales bacterium]|nr:hypothetical protein [Clostridiales bacterium]